MIQLLQQIIQIIQIMTTREDRIEMAEIEDLALLPQKYKQIWIMNKRLLKQLDIMKMEIFEKDRIIRELKLQIDSTILEDTKNRLEYIRLVEDQVTEKTKQVKQEYLDQTAKYEVDVQAQLEANFKLERELEFEREQNLKLCAKIKDLKDHLIMAMDEKDLIINQLVKIVTDKDTESKASALRNRVLEQRHDAQQSTSKGKGRVYIKRNV